MSIYVLYHIYIYHIYCMSISICLYIIYIYVCIYMCGYIYILYMDIKVVELGRYHVLGAHAESSPGNWDSAGMVQLG